MPLDNKPIVDVSKEILLTRVALIDYKSRAIEGSKFNRPLSTQSELQMILAIDDFGQNLLSLILCEGVKAIKQYKWLTKNRTS